MGKHSFKILPTKFESKIVFPCFCFCSLKCQNLVSPVFVVPPLTYNIQVPPTQNFQLLYNRFAQTDH